MRDLPQLSTSAGTSLPVRLPETGRVNTVVTNRMRPIWGGLAAFPGRLHLARHCGLQHPPGGGVAHRPRENPAYV